uniref:PD-(D/E)XK endonuclease-like domain-containing protein n=1 Tax=uncultured marine group II/III euryarchaeote KM3_180_D08 TaxID=1457942 RepID=A0A075GTV5_9EURY|nr:hypothetical protein [uncultured marine group II/III euryarchaeote KM3_180_D08]
MPVCDPSDDDPIGPFKRISHTQADMHRRCPRMWYNGYGLGLKGGHPPIFGMGHSVEGSLNRIMRDCPVLVASNDSSKTFDSPLEEVLLPGQEKPKERPSCLDDADWPGPRLQVLPEAEWPTSRAALREWALARLEVHFPREWAAVKAEWEADANRVGDWDEFEAANMDAAKSWVANGVDFHLDEVELCLNADGGSDLAQWRAGEGRPEWPSPDGFPYGHSLPHPCAREGDVTWCEAWEIARPWFCDPDAGTFSLTSTHPEGWLGGEYDLVYRWTGEVRIFDVKASDGTSDFSFGYVDQMATYAYLWWVTHGRQEVPTDLQIWYLGAPARKQIPVPDERSMLRLENRLKGLHARLRETSEFNEEDFPANPTPVRSFGLGGVPLDEAPIGDMARCGGCEYRGVCSASPHRQELPRGENAQHPVTRAASIECTPIGAIDPFVTVRGAVRKLRKVAQWPSYEREFWEFFLDFADRDWVAVVVKLDEPNLPAEFAEGAVVRLRNGIIGAGWKKDLGNHLRLDMSASSSIEMAPTASAEDTPFTQLRPRTYNVKAQLFNFEHSETEDYSKWGARLIDASGVIPFQIWNLEKAVDVLREYQPERGDEVLIVGATAKDQHGKLVLEGKITKRLTTRLTPSTS